MTASDTARRVTETTPEQNGRPGIAGLDAAFVMCALLLVGASAIYLMFADREINFDEATAYNQVYMLRHYGQLAWPAIGRSYDLIVHPPLHYCLVALLMSSGLSLFHAAGLIPVVLFAVTAMLLVYSRFPPSVKFGVLFGTFLAAFVWNETYTLRPELSLAVAWIAGLAGLESGRLASWDWRRLLLGSVLTGYASIVHYPGSVSILGVGVYIVWAWVSLPRPVAVRRIGVLCLGACLVWVPYLTVYVYPHRHAIIATLRENQSGWTVVKAFRWHLECYAYWARELASRSAYQPFVSLLLYPLFSLRIPAVFIGATVLFCFRATRGMALASLIYPLFLLFGAQHKHFVNPGYFVPELIVYLAGLIAAAMFILLGLLARLPKRWPARGGAWLAVASLAVLTLLDRPLSADRGRLVADLDELDLGRAIGRRIVGPNALVATMGMAPWYTCGARHYYSPRRELLYAPTIAGLDLPKYFSQFDALVADPPHSFDASNKERENPTTSYVKGLLNLRGFYLADRGGRPQSDLSLLFYSAVLPEHLTGYVVRDRRVYRFEEDAGGDAVFFCAACLLNDFDNASKYLDFFATYYLTVAPNTDPRFDNTCRNGPPVLRVLVTDKSQFEREILPAAKRCTVREQATGRLTEVDREKLLQELRGSDRPIVFYANLSSALMATGRVGPSATEAVASSLGIEAIKSVSPEASLARISSGVRITTPAPQWSYAASAPVRISDPELASGYIHVRARVLKGAVGFGLLMNGSEDFATEHFWDSRDGATEAFIPVTSFKSVDTLMIRNIAETRSPSEVVVEEVGVLRDRRPSGRVPVEAGVVGTPLRRIGYCGFARGDQ